MRSRLIFFEGFSGAALERACASGRCPTLARLRREGLLAGMSDPFAGRRAVAMAGAMTGSWPHEHGILGGLTWERKTGAWRASRADDGRRPTYWETLDGAGVPVVSVGWPGEPARTSARGSVVGAGFGFTPRRDHVPVVAEWVNTVEVARAVEDCWLRPDDFGAEVLAALVPRWREFDQTEENGLGAIASVLAWNISRFSAFAGLTESGAGEHVTVCLSLPGELFSLAANAARRGDERLGGLGENAWPLYDAWVAALVGQLPERTLIAIAGSPHSEKPGEPGFLLMKGEAVEAEFFPRRVGMQELAPFFLRHHGVGLGTRAPSRLAKAIRPGRALLRMRSEREEPPASGDAIAAWLGAGDAGAAAMRGARRERREQGQVLAQSLMWAGKSAEAIPVLKVLVRDEPTWMEARLLLSRCLQYAGLMTEATDEAYAALDPYAANHAAALLRLAELKLLAGEREEARALLKQVEGAARTPGVLPLDYARVLVWLREWRGAQRVLQDLSEVEPDAPEPRVWLARTWLGLREWQASVDEAMASIRLDGGSARIFEILGHGLLQLGLETEAARAFALATETEPSWPRPWLKRIWLARRTGQPADVIAALERDYKRAKAAGENRRSRGLGLGETGAVEAP